MGKGSKPPPAPDPNEVAAAQGQANRETAIAQARLNQIEEITPYGTSRYEPTGQTVDGIDQFRRVTELAPDQQRMLDAQNRAGVAYNELAAGQVGRVADAMATPFSYDGMPDAPRADREARDQVTDALYGQYTSRLDPRFAQQEADLRARLATQGITEGSEAYDRAMGNFGRERNDAYGSALNQAVAAGGAEQSRLFGLEASARERAIQEEAYRRQVPLNEASALMGQGAVTMPQFSPTPQTGIAPTDITSPTYQSYQGQMNAWQTQQNNRNALYGALLGTAGSIGGAFIGA